MAVWAAIGVAGLTVTAVILRLTMALVRWARNPNKRGGTHGLRSGATSEANLIDAASRAGSSHASTLSRDPWGQHPSKWGVAGMVSTVPGSGTSSPILLGQPHASPDKLSALPLHMRLLKSDKHTSLPQTVHNNEQLNAVLSSVVSNSSLHSLDSSDFHAQYRQNWDQEFRRTQDGLPHIHSLSHLSHPSESAQILDNHSLYAHQDPGKPASTRDTSEIKTRF